MNYALYFLLSGLLALIFTPLIKKLAVKTGTLDVPSSPRKIHKLPTPLLGGIAVFLAFAIALGTYIYISQPDKTIVPTKFFLAILLGGIIISIGGFFDDKFNLPPKILWLVPACASLVIVLSGIGIGIKEISNPFGSPIRLDGFLFGIPISGIFIWFWMMGMIFTTKFLDGLDGLASGITAIASLTLFWLSLTDKINQPITASIAIIFSGVLCGYLFFAFNPASIFLGEAGSEFCGFILGVLSVILGGKIATALLVMGIPIMDVAWVIVRRLWYKTSPFSGDRKHLHFRLLDIGFSQRQTVLILYSISAIFGAVAISLQSLGKLIALIVLSCFMVGLAIFTVIMYKRQHPHIHGLLDKIK